MIQHWYQALTAIGLIWVPVLAALHQRHQVQRLVHQAAPASLWLAAQVLRLLFQATIAPRLLT